jgi:DNA-directed RNA polymerase subunit beta'
MMHRSAHTPVGAGVPSSFACLGLHLATRARPAPPARPYRDRDRVLEAHARGALGLSDTIRVGDRTTTAGRYLVAECLPRAYRDAADAPWDAARGTHVIARITRELHVELAARAVAALEQLGRFVADRSGFSLALADFEPPPEADAVIAEARGAAAAVEREYLEGQITDGERYHRVLDIWFAAAARLRVEARKCAPELDPLAACAASCPETPQPECLRSIRGVIPTASGWGELAAGMVGTLARGASAHQYFLACAEARRAALDARERAREAALLFRDLFAVLGDLEIVAIDCGTERGVRVRGLPSDDRPGSLAHLVEGRVTAETVVDRAGEVIAPAGALITPALARRIEAARVASVVIRDVRACDARGGVCARCLGLAPEDAIWPTIGDDIGARASAAIAAAAQRLARDQVFHIC